MNILLTNDDGIKGAGLWALAEGLKVRGHDVTIAAPFNQQSGMSHALTFIREIEYRRFDNPDFEAWTFDGTPTDCVKIYLEGMAVKKFDALISGINDGSNLATDVLYSGTVGAALEGFLHAIPSLAVSRDKNSEIPFDVVADGTVDYLEKILGVKHDAGRAYFKIGGTIYDSDSSAGTDIYATEQGFVSVTPLHCDAADYDEIVELRKIFRG